MFLFAELIEFNLQESIIYMSKGNNQHSFGFLKTQVQDRKNGNHFICIIFLTIYVNTNVDEMQLYVSV